ncbi:discoidin domain-containing protein [Coleofasciculus sp. FACHB-T130]|uniref:discoidin domain-containing protein n=1 Tax=Cyanophyceae TaxID=3028117 RepID=UPI00168345B4|nr:discoidin domain-containing protein [Coleofasciculus sp. FACHB-T130]MBD1878479.1 discoidin domain-containing protein [Coleofasciculus sp. FACHB-T130]
MRIQSVKISAFAFLVAFTLIGCSKSTEDLKKSSPVPSKAQPDREVKVAAKKLNFPGVNVAVKKQVIARAGGITYPGWANANDNVDYKTTTNYPQLGRWGNETNNGKGTFQVVDLGSVYQLNGVGYNIDWDGAFKNSLTFRVEVSTDNKSWQLVSNIVHPYAPTTVFNKLDIDVAIKPTAARYVKYWEPPDGQWNGWGTFHQLRAYSSKSVKR